MEILFTQKNGFYKGLLHDVKITVIKGKSGTQRPMSLFLTGNVDNLLVVAVKTERTKLDMLCEDGHDQR